MDDRLAKWLLENNLLEQIRVLKTDVALLQKLGATTDIYDPIFISGTGDVVGPNSSTDGNVALFNGTTGKIIKEGGVPVIGVEDGVAGATLAYGNLVYLSSVDDRWELASASAEATCSKKLGICILTAANDGDATKVLTTGNVTSNSFPAMTVGQAIYAGTTAGTISTTPPSSNAGEIIRIVGHAIGANVLYFHPSSDYFEIGTPTSYGDVVGPNSAVDGNLVAFDTTTGKLIKDSGIAMDNPALSPYSDNWKNIFIFDEFIGGGEDTNDPLFGSLGWKTNGGNNALVGNTTSIDNFPGLLSFATNPTGSGGSGLAYLRLGFVVNEANLKFSQFSLMALANLDYAEDGVGVGLFEDFATDGSVAGIYFKVAYGDTNWQAVTKDGGGTTQTDTGVPYASSGVVFGITRTLSSVEFYIDTVLVATHSTNKTTTNMAPAFVLSSGTDMFSVLVDYFGLQFAPIAQRWN
jgi:hypothetical protein